MIRTSMIAPSLTLAPGLTREYMLHHKVCPKDITADGVLIIATTVGGIRDGADDIAFAYERPVEFEIVEREELERLIERLTTRSERSIELASAESAGDDFATD